MNTKSLIRCSRIQLLFAVGASCLLLQSASATVLFSEGFNYPPGGLSGNGGWTGGGPAALAVDAGNLTYPNLADLGGGELKLTSGIAASTDVTSFNGAAITSGTIFYSFLLNPTLMPSANVELMDLLPTGATGLQGSTAALAVYVGSQNATQYKLGVRHGLSGATYASSSLMTVNTTNFFVVAYTFNGGVGDDTVSLWVNPTPGGSQPVADVSFGNSALADSAGLQVLGIKAQSATTQGNWNLDTLRIGTAWADVTPVTVPEPSTLVLVASGLALMFGAIRRRS